MRRASPAVGKTVVFWVFVLCCVIEVGMVVEIAFVKWKVDLKGNNDGCYDSSYDFQISNGLLDKSTISDKYALQTRYLQTLLDVIIALPVPIIAYNRLQRVSFLFVQIHQHLFTVVCTSSMAYIRWNRTTGVN